MSAPSAVRTDASGGAAARTPRWPRTDKALVTRAEGRLIEALRQARAENRVIEQRCRKLRSQLAWMESMANGGGGGVGDTS